MKKMKFIQGEKAKTLSRTKDDAPSADQENAR
jgi:hypothetical protein